MLFTRQLKHFFIACPCFMPRSYRRRLSIYNLEWPSAVRRAISVAPAPCAIQKVFSSRAFAGRRTAGPNKRKRARYLYTRIMRGARHCCCSNFSRFEPIARGRGCYLLFCRPISRARSAGASRCAGPALDSIDSVMQTGRRRREYYGAARGEREGERRRGIETRSAPNLISLAIISALPVLC